MRIQFDPLLNAVRTDDTATAINTSHVWETITQFTQHNFDIASTITEDADFILYMIYGTIGNRYGLDARDVMVNIQFTAENNPFPKWTKVVGFDYSITGTVGQVTDLRLVLSNKAATPNVFQSINNTFIPLN